MDKTEKQVLLAVGGVFFITPFITMALTYKPGDVLNIPIYVLGFMCVVVGLGMVLFGDSAKIEVEEVPKEQAN